MAITSAGADVVISWPSTAVGFVLQSTPSLGAQAQWTAVSQQPVIENGRYKVTVPATGTAQY